MVRLKRCRAVCNSSRCWVTCGGSSDFERSQGINTVDGFRIWEAFREFMGIQEVHKRHQEIRKRHYIVRSKLQTKLPYLKKTCPGCSLWKLAPKLQGFFHIESTLALLKGRVHAVDAQPKQQHHPTAIKLYSSLMNASQLKLSPQHKQNGMIMQQIGLQTTWWAQAWFRVWYIPCMAKRNWFRLVNLG